MKFTIGEQLTGVYNYLLYGSTYLTEVYLPETIINIGNYSFANCTSLTTLDIPASVTTIGSYAFRNCTGFESFKWGVGIQTVNDHAFEGCTGLTSFTIPGHVTSIGHRAFDGCTAITSLKFEPGTETLSLGFINYYNDASSDERNRGLFNDCPLESVDLNRTLSYSAGAKYGFSPFANIKTLMKFTIGEQLTKVYNYICYGNVYLTEVNLPETATSIGNYSFSGCSTLTSLVIPSSITAIGESTFQNCTGFSNFTLGTGIETIGYKAFSGCTGLTSFTIPGHVTSIGHRAFDGCTAITYLKFEPGTETLSLGFINYYNDASSDERNRGLFNDCPLESVDLNRTLSYSAGAKYGFSPFANIKTLEKIELGGDTRAYNYLCYGNFKVKNVIISESVTAIGNYTFCGCDSITSLSLPDSLLSIGDYAFSGCKQLTGLIFHPALKSIGNYAFKGCTAFNNFAFEESEETLTLGNGASEGEKVGLFKDCPIISVFIGRNLSYNYAPLANIKTLTEARFGNPVTRIPNYIFQGDTELSNVEFNKSCQLQSVGKYAFDGCINLPTPQFPGTVTVFDEGAFRGCTNFTDFELPEKLVTIGSYTFQDCTGLTEFKIPSTTTSIGTYAFSGCTGVKLVIFADGEETLALGYGASKGKGYGLFNDCPLEEVYLGRTVSYDVNSNGTYGYSPFYKQEALTNITIGPNVSGLPYCIFWGTGIKELYVPSSVRTLQSSFANGCPNLKNIIILGATPPSVDNANTLLSGTAEGSKFYVFFPDKYAATKPWNNYSDRIAPIGSFNDNFTYNGNSHSITYQTDLPITLSNLETEIEGGNYTKQVEVSYSTNGYQLSDILTYEYTIRKASQEIFWGFIEDTLTVGDKIALTAKASSGLAVSYTTDNKGCIEFTEQDGILYAECLKGGKLYIMASQAGDNNYDVAENVIWTTFIVNPRSWSVELNDTILTLTEQVVDYEDKHINGDGTSYYRAKLSLDITTNGFTQTYNIDNSLYIDDSEASLHICMLVDLTKRNIIVFSNSKMVNRDYKMAGYAWTSSLDNIAFVKEQVFEQKNWGWAPYFNVESDGSISLQHFSWESYYAVKSVRYENGTWTSKNIGSISPAYAYQLRDEHDRILVLGGKQTAVAGYPADDNETNTFYNLSGQRLTQPEQGKITIINGKKVLIREQ